MKTSREQFEKWALDETSFDLFRTDYPNKGYDEQQYKDVNTNTAWTAWQASRQCIEITLAEPFTMNNGRTKYVYTRDVEDACINAGIKIKGA